MSGDPRAMQRGGPGVSAALRFLAAARTNPTLRQRVAEVAPELGLEPVVQIAAEAGFQFAPEDLRAAFTHDWGFRRARYLREPPAADSDASTVAVVNSPSSST